MTTEIANAYLAIYAKMPGVQADMAKQLGDADVDKVGQDLGKRTGEGYTKGFALAGAVGGLVATVASAAASSLSDFVGGAVSASDATDKFRKTLSFAGTDANTIDTLTKQVRSYADATVYDLGDIQNTVAQLAANGIGDYERLTEAAGNLNAVAGGNAETFKSVGMVLTQTAGAGKLTTENWNQLADAIPGASGILQNALASNGAFVGNFREAMEKGEITADEFNAALMQVGMNPIAVEAARSTETFEGALGNLQATISGGLTDAIGSIKPQLVGAINGFSDLIANGIEAGKVLKAAFTGKLMEDDSFLPLSVVQNLMAFGQGAREVFDAVGPLASQLFDLWQQFSPLSIIFQAIQPALPGLVSAFSSLAAAIGGALGGALQAILPALQPLAQTLVTVLASVIGAVLPVITQLATQLGPILSTILVALAPLFAQIAGVITQVLTAVLPLIAPILALISPLVELVFTILQPLIDLFMALITPILGLVAPLLALVKPIVELVLQLLEPLIALFTTILSAVLPPLTAVIAALITPIMGVVTAIADSLMPIIEGLTRVLGGVIDFIVGVFTGNWERAWQGIVDIFGGIWDTVVGIVKGVLNTVISVINGVIDGINGVAGAVSDATGGAIGFKIGRIPMLAQGGIVSARSGGTLAVIGEGRYDEAVLPLSPEVLSKLGGGGAPVTVHATFTEADPRIAIRQMGRELKSAMAGGRR